MEPILEVILEFVLEIVLQVFGELFCELGTRMFPSLYQRDDKISPAFAAVGYCLLGSIIGGLSLFLFKNSFIHNSSFRVVNLFLAPFVAGIVMAGVGALRRKKGQSLVRLDRFGYGFSFAFGMALVRFLYAAK